MAKKRKLSKTAAIAIRKQKSADLLFLAKALDENRVCDVSPLHRAASDCANNLGRPDNCWGYNLDDLLFNLDTPRNTRPSTIGKELRLRLSAQISCRIFDDSHNPFDDLQINLEIFDESPPACNSYISWHFDKHIPSQEGAELCELHPLFHFQHGGHKTHGYIADDLGKILLLAPPRLPHPPMDGILAIDFILSNFKGTVWQHLTNVPEYRRLVSQSQQKFWRPYTDLLKTAFEGEGPEETDPVLDIWPALLSARSTHEKLLLKRS